jgi:hypothetical protein
MTLMRRWPFRTAALLPQKLAVVVPLCVSTNGLPKMARQCPISTPAPLPQPRQTTAFRLRQEEKAYLPDPATQEGGPPDHGPRRFGDLRQCRTAFVCLGCGGGDHGHDSPLPLAGLHSRCLPASYVDRKAEAVAAPAAMGIALPAELPNDFGKNWGM